ncbi:MAG: hypothetical protein KDC26_00650 [Armatimonadetes bacterium]|nr:hypothetical protein [Armatimonadota bacterium]
MAFSGAPNRGIEFSVISEAFEFVKANIGAVCGFYAVGLIASYVVSYAIQLPTIMAQVAAASTDNAAAATGFSLAALPFQMLGGIAQYGVLGLFNGGIAYMVIKYLRGEKVEFGDGFNAFSQALPLILGGIIASFLTALGLIGCIVGAFVVGGLFIPLYTILVHEKLSVMEALKRSAELVKPYLVMGAVFFLVQGLLGSLGVLACCIGIFFTMPMMAACGTFIYRDLTGTDFGGQFAPAGGPSNYPREAGGSMPEYGNEEPRDPNTPPEM